MKTKLWKYSVHFFQHKKNPNLNVFLYFLKNIRKNVEFDTQVIRIEISFIPIKYLLYNSKFLYFPFFNRNFNYNFSTNVWKHQSTNSTLIRHDPNVY